MELGIAERFLGPFGERVGVLGRIEQLPQTRSARQLKAHGNQFVGSFHDSRIAPRGHEPGGDGARPVPGRSTCPFPRASNMFRGSWVCLSGADAERPLTGSWQAGGDAFHCPSLRPLALLADDRLGERVWQQRPTPAAESAKAGRPVRGQSAASQQASRPSCW